MHIVWRVGEQGKGFKIRRGNGDTNCEASLLSTVLVHKIYR